MTQPDTSTKTRKVRLKVLIGSSGRYVGHGWTDAGDKDPDDVLYESGVDDINVKEYWIVADVPIPGAATEEIVGGIE